MVITAVILYSTLLDKREGDCECLAVLVGTLNDIMHSLPPHPNHQNQMLNPKPYPNSNQNLTLTSAHKTKMSSQQWY